MKNKKKGTGERIVYLYTNVLRVSREEFLRLYPMGRTTLIAIENESGGEPTLEKLISELKLSSSWVRENKLPIFLSGTDEENVARIKQGKATAQEPYRDELIVELRRRAETAEADKSRLQTWVDRLISGNPNFLKPLGKKTPLAKLA